MDKEKLEFKKYLCSLNLKESTIKNYLWHLEKFFIWLENKKINEKLLQNYFEYILKKYPRVNSINLRLIILNSYLKFLNKRFRFELLSQEKNNLKIISQRQLQKFLEAPLAEKGIIAKRDKAILELLYGSGIKVGQLTNIELNQIDEIKKQIIFDQKNIWNIGPSAWFYLEKYRQNRNKLNIQRDNKYLFINFDRRPKNQKRQLSVRSIERIINKYAKISNPQILINPQILRNTLAYRLKSEGAQNIHIKETLHFKTKAAAGKYLERL